MVPSRDLSDGVEAEERTVLWPSGEGVYEEEGIAGISRASRAIVRKVSLMS